MAEIPPSKEKGVIKDEKVEEKERPEYGGICNCVYRYRHCAYLRGDKYHKAGGKFNIF